MYIVVSKWGVLSGRENEADRQSRKVRDALRALPGIELLKHFVNQDGVIVAIVGYESEERYHAIVDDPNGPFARAIEEHGLNNLGAWVGSDRGWASD